MDKAQSNSFATSVFILAVLAILHRYILAVSLGDRTRIVRLHQLPLLVSLNFDTLALKLRSPALVVHVVPNHDVGKLEAHIRSDRANLKEDLHVSDTLNLETRHGQQDELHVVLFVDALVNLRNITQVSSIHVIVSVHDASFVEYIHTKMLTSR